MTAAECPVCRLKGGFHDQATHNKVSIPEHLILQLGWYKDAHEEVKKLRKLAEDDGRA